MKKHKIKSAIQSWTPYTKNKLVNCLSYLITLFLVLGFNYCFIIGAFMPKFFILDLALMILSIAPIFFFKKTMFDRIYIPFLFFFIVLFFIINVQGYKFMGTIFSFKDILVMFDNIGQAGMRINQLNWWNIAINIIVIGGFISWILVFNIKLRFNETKTIKSPSRKTITIFASVFTAAALVNYEFTMATWVWVEKARNVDSIKYVNFNTNYHVKNMGIFNYYNREIRQLLFNDNVSDQTIMNYLSNYSPITNSYTGLLKDKNPNIFCILLETGDKLMLNQYTTPNLYNFLNGGGEKNQVSGINCNHNYSYNHTNVSNILSFAGCYPSHTMRQKRIYNTPFALPKILKANNYCTRFYHDITREADASCYGDYEFMKNTIGFDNVLFHEDFLSDIEPWTWEDCFFNPDSVVSEHIIADLNKFIQAEPNKPFYSHWMSMFMHMDQVINNKNKAKVDKLYDTYGSTLKQLEQEGKWVNTCKSDEAKLKYELYTLKTMDFDVAFGNLLNYFYGSESSDYLKNTILVVFGDHSWYETSGGKQMSQLIKNIDDVNNINLYSTVMGIYHPLLTNKTATDTSGLFSNNGHTLNKMTSIACIVPTILDLLGISYNHKIYQDHSMFDLYGESTFNESNHEIMYSDWITLYMNEHYTSDNGAFVSTIVNDNKTTKEFINKVKDKQLQLRILNSIYYNNFFDRHNYKDFIIE